MICPYCGQRMDETITREHFFPRSLRDSEWDFFCCYKCNWKKNNHVVFPSQDLFQAIPTELSKQKFKDLWRLSGWNKYTLLVPWRQMRDIFLNRSTFYADREYSVSEQEFYEFEKVQKILRLGAKLVQDNKEVQSMVLCRDSMKVLILHNYDVNIQLGNGYLAMKTSDYVWSNIHGYLVAGTGENWVWKNTISGVEFFKKLL